MATKIVCSELLSTRWIKKVEVQRLSSRIYWLAIEITIQLVRILAFSILFSLRLSVCPSYFWVLFFHIKSDNCRKLIVFVLIKTKPLSHYINVHISLNVFYFICVVISAVESGAFPMSAIFSGISIVILFVLVFCVVSILWKRSQQHKADDVTDGSKQSSSLLCTSVVGNTNGTANANHTDTITKVSAFELS